MSAEGQIAITVLSAYGWFDLWDRLERRPVLRELLLVAGPAFFCAYWWLAR